jgi:L-cystine uptake protein TcyP (sodium:dicarboxylate symporter family)
MANQKEKEKKKMGLSTQIFIALLLGAVSGVLIHYYMPDSSFKNDILMNGILYVIGNGFIRLMQYHLFSVRLYAEVWQLVILRHLERLALRLYFSIY